MKNLNQMELDLSTSSQEAILANLSPSQVEKKVSKIRDTSGQTILGLSKSSGPLGSLEKMLVGTLNKVSTPYYRTWRVKVTPQGRLVFQLQASARTTKGRESSLWRTPDNLAGGSNLPGIQKALDAFKRLLTCPCWTEHSTAGTWYFSTFLSPDNFARLE